MTHKELFKKALAWDRLYERAQKTPTMMATMMDEILEKLTPEYHDWAWAWERLCEGKKVAWKKWGSSFICIEGGYIRRRSMLDEKWMDMGVYGKTQVEKFTEKGWTLWEEK